MAGPGTIDEIAGTCLLSAVRKLSRIVTSIYDDELRPHGIKGSQLNLLVVIAKAGPVRRSAIGRHAAIDRSTLTRNLAVMAANGWIEEVTAQADGRGHPLRITKDGQQLIEDASPAWQRAQRRAGKALGGDRMAALRPSGNATGNDFGMSEDTAQSQD